MTIKIDAHRSPAELAAREAILAAMREKWRRNPPRQLMRKRRRKQPRAERAPKARPLTAATLARAIRIAAEIAAKEPSSNPLFVEALEIAATYFDEL